MAWADDVRLGVISWVKSSNEHISRHLLSFLEIRKPEFTNYYGLNHARIKNAAFVDIKPFMHSVPRVSQLTVPINILDDWYDYDWKAGVYLMAKGTPTIWYQMNININQKLLQHANKKHVLNLTSDLVGLTRISGERPTVAWSKQ